MGITKTKGFSKDVNSMAEVFKAIGHPARLAIIQYLIESPSCICNDIVNELPLAQPTISRHLSELKKVGLIKGEISGKNICYCLNEKVWEKVKTFVTDISIDIVHSKKCC